MLKLTRLISRIGLSALIILSGVIAALLMGETKGLALADLPGTSVRALAATNGSNMLYAGLTRDSWPAGLYRSDDNGQTWQAVAPELNIDISALAVDPGQNTTLYAGTSGGSLFKASSLWASQDGGQTWRRFVAPLPANPEGLLPAVTTLVVDPNQPNILYVGTDGHGVYRYDLARNGYELLAGVGLRQGHVKDLAVDAAGQVYALTEAGLFVTGGERWQQLKELPDAPVRLALAPGKTPLLYLGTASKGIYRSADGGQSWEPASQGLADGSGPAQQVTALAVDERNPRSLAAAVAYNLDGQLRPGGVYESHDAGQHWTRLDGPSVLVTGLTYRGGTAYAATVSGLARYHQPAGDSWFGTLLGHIQTPSGIQLLILVLAIGLAGLVLLYGEKWLSDRGDWLAG